MPTGIITTARGCALNLDELIIQSQRPPTPMKKSTRENAGYKPNESRQPKLRGYVPGAGSATPPVSKDQQEANKPVGTSASRTKTDKSLADETGIKVTSKNKRGAAAQTTAKTPAQSETDDELGDLIGKLDKK